MRRVLDDDGKPLPGVRTPSIPDATLARMFEVLLQTQLLMRVAQTVQLGGHLVAMGEEAAQLAVAPLGANDWVFPGQGDHVAWLWRGYTVQQLVDQTLGNAEDASKGRQAPGHHAARWLNLVSISAPAGTQLPQAVGAAHAARMLGRDDVMMALFGEAATSTGEFHVGLNFAAVWQAPCVFVCRNSGWAGGAQAVQTAARTIAAKAIGYGVPGVRVDGNDALAVWQVASEAIARARAGDGPTLIEALTHVIGRAPDSPDGNPWLEPIPALFELREEPFPKDPLHRLRGYLRHAGLWSERWEAELVGRHFDEIARAVATGENKPEPAIETLFDDVYEHLPWHLREQRAYLQAQPRAGDTRNEHRSET
ncbi:MAG TPA: thiamine pyrophosphate-dependent dehydrogenase E1 component subunit alpha [Kofleriaceae bacterium]|nr:thiamine pyrophosphate-dependent dehydrogenase E1 component subunit alpha [Kofleriaceae bacterium]